jgi:hypothetical protein
MSLKIRRRERRKWAEEGFKRLPEKNSARAVFARATALPSEGKSTNEALQHSRRS